MTSTTTTNAPTTSTKPAPERGSRIIGGVANYIDERTSISGLVKEVGRKIFPDHWSFMLGEVALYSFVVILLSGTFLTFFFGASMTEVVYNGSYVPLKGVEMSTALQSTLNISFDIRGGLFVRQIHHWAALLFVASVMLHMARVFFTGAFRKPRELNWVFGFVLWVLAMAEGFTGYSLPDDLLSGNGLRIIVGMIEGVPVIGVWIGYILFGGEFPGTAIVGRLYTLHILLLPAILVAVLGVHLVLVVINKHTQYAGPGKTNENVVGVPILPAFAAKAGGFFFIVAGILALIASLFTINPIWNYGPYDPSPVSAGTQPDWYIGFADGALRLVPPHWEVVWFGYTVSFNILVPIAVLMGLILAMFVYPFVEAWVTGDKREHHIADRPRNAPTRTAFGAAGVTLYASLWAAASSDIIATHFMVSIDHVIHVIQATTILGPFVAFWIAKRVCLALQKKDREIVLHGYESGRIVRLPHGEYIEVHEQLDEYERWKLLQFEEYKPLMVRPNAKGQITSVQKVRAGMSRFFFEDRIAPVSKSELEAAHAAHHGPDLEGSAPGPAGRSWRKVTPLGKNESPSSTSWTGAFSFASFSRNAASGSPSIHEHVLDCSRTMWQGVAPCTPPAGDPLPRNHQRNENPMDARTAEHPRPNHFLLHLSDTHLIAGDGDLYGAVDSAARLTQIIDDIEASGARPEAIVVTGDVADKGEPGAYARVRQIIEPAANRIGAQVIWAMGNHDERGAFRQELFGLQPTDRPVDFVYDVNGLRVITLDTSVPGKHHGVVTPEQLDWLAEVLSEAAPHGTILAMHHPPVPSVQDLTVLVELREQRPSPRSSRAPTS